MNDECDSVEECYGKSIPVTWILFHDDFQLKIKLHFQTAPSSLLLKNALSTSRETKVLLKVDEKYQIYYKRTGSIKMLSACRLIVNFIPQLRLDNYIFNTASNDVHN